MSAAREPSEQAYREAFEVVAEALHRRWPAFDFIPCEPGAEHVPGARVLTFGSARDDVVPEPVGHP